jgi:Fe-S-cluster-containing hydrogenase component 2
MAKLLLIDGEKCAGCRTCEMVCSAQHEKVINPFQSRIKVIKWDRDGEGFPTACAQCQDAPCKAVCPVKAISRDEVLGRTMIDYDRCIGCRMCVAACPFGLVHFDPLNRRVAKCDLCDGDPMCAKFCPYEAVLYVDEAALGTPKRRVNAEKLRAYMRQAAGAVKAGN